LGPNAGWGAWQLGIRYSDYKVTEPSIFTGRKNVAGSVSKGESTLTNGNTSRGENSEGGKTITLGLNWILNPNARILFNYADTRFDRPLTYLTTDYPTKLGSTSSEQVISVRTQLNF